MEQTTRGQGKPGLLARLASRIYRPEVIEYDPEVIDLPCSVLGRDYAADDSQFNELRKNRGQPPDITFTPAKS